MAACSALCTLFIALVPSLARYIDVSPVYVTYIISVPGVTAGAVILVRIYPAVWEGKPGLCVCGVYMGDVWSVYPPGVQYIPPCTLL